MFTCAWLWIYFGLFLMLMELVTPGFILCFFGLAAITVGCLRYVFGDAFDATWQLAALSAFSVLYIVLLRRWFRRAMTGDKSDDRDLPGEYVGRTGRITEPVQPPHTGRVMIGDSEWTAEAEAAIAAGVEVRVISQHNLTMKVEVL